MNTTSEKEFEGNIRNKKVVYVYERGTRVCMNREGRYLIPIWKGVKVKKGRRITIKNNCVYTYKGLSSLPF